MIRFDNDETKLSLIIEENGKKLKIPVIFTKEGNDRLWVDFRFNRPLMAEIKAMEGAKWHGYDDEPVKMWSIKDTARNRFQLAYLAGMNPYAKYDAPLIEINDWVRTVFEHQKELTCHGLTRQYCILAAEMGTGKSLAAIEIMERSGFSDWWWIGPRSVLAAIYIELYKWKSKVIPSLYSYDDTKRILASWENGKPPPRGIVCDESSRLKNPTSQRSQAIRKMSDAIRYEWGDKGYVLEMSGSPAPKDPSDWWNQCEIACPGYLREGTIGKFVARYAVTELVENGGMKYPRKLGWKDSTNRCAICGQMKESPDHLPDDDNTNPHSHDFDPCENEVAALYHRMQGLVMVKLKKDCLDLPDKIYRLVKLRPIMQTVQAAKMIAVGAMSAIQKMIRLRELSDGFQYREEEVGKELCTNCNGSKYIDNLPCVKCSAAGSITTWKREYTELPTPKEQAVIDLLDEHDEIGRLVIYGAFTASIDRIEKICKSQHWEVIRVDGRGWKWSGAFAADNVEMLRIFQEKKDEYPRVVFIGHPGSAGMGLTLTASSTIVYYSNDFNAESRIQSEDRIHRAGMDVVRGATIIDLIHLPTDNLVLANLKKKRDLQSITMGEISEALNESYSERTT